eukprot:2667579-Ditylum_brightwellii.AAC.1
MPGLVHVADCCDDTHSCIGHFVKIYGHDEQWYASRQHQDDTGMVSKAYFASSVGREEKKNGHAGTILATNVINGNCQWCHET